MVELGFAVVADTVGACGAKCLAGCVTMLGAAKQLRKERASDVRARLCIKAGLLVQNWIDCGNVDTLHLEHGGDACGWFYRQ